MKRREGTRVSVGAECQGGTVMSWNEDATRGEGGIGRVRVAQVYKGGVGLRKFLPCFTRMRESRVEVETIPVEEEEG